MQTLSSAWGGARRPGTETPPRSGRWLTPSRAARFFAGVPHVSSGAGAAMVLLDHGGRIAKLERRCRAHPGLVPRRLDGQPRTLIYTPEEWHRACRKPNCARPPTAVAPTPAAACGAEARTFLRTRVDDANARRRGQAAGFLKLLRERAGAARADGFPTAPAARCDTPIGSWRDARRARREPRPAPGADRARRARRQAAGAGRTRPRLRHLHAQHEGRISSCTRERR